MKNNNIVKTIFDGQDPLNESNGEVFYNRGWNRGLGQYASASSFAVYVRKVAGSDTDNVLQVKRPLRPGTYR